MACSKISDKFFDFHTLYAQFWQDVAQREGDWGSVPLYDILVPAHFANPMLYEVFFLFISKIVKNVVLSLNFRKTFLIHFVNLRFTK